MSAPRRFSWLAILAAALLAVVVLIASVPIALYLRARAAWSEIERAENAMGEQGRVWVNGEFFGERLDRTDWRAVFCEPTIAEVSFNAESQPPPADFYVVASKAATLSLTGRHITDEVVQRAVSPELIVFRITNVAVTDRTFDSLTQCAKLRAAHLDGTNDSLNLIGPLLARVNHWPQMEFLSVDANRFELSQLNGKIAQNEITMLWVELIATDDEQTSLERGHLDWLSHMPKLATLSLSGNGINDDTMKHIAELRPDLATLALKGQFTAQAFQHLSLFSKLEVIQLEYCSISKEDTLRIKDYPDLERVRLKIGEPVDEEFLDQFADMKRLWSIMIEFEEDGLETYVQRQFNDRTQ